jgi:hypothetical protein
MLASNCCGNQRQSASRLQTGMRRHPFVIDLGRELHGPAIRNRDGAGVNRIVCGESGVQFITRRCFPSVSSCET